RSPDEYRAGLRDGRRVFYRGEQVADVTTHEVFRHAVEHAALDYRLAEDPRYRELAATADGYSRYFHVPRSAEDLLARSALIEAATRAGKTLVVLIKEIGTDALFALRALGPDDADYALAFAVPLDTPGLTLVASPYLSTKGKAAVEFPLSAERKMVETATLFDDVFVPAERVFLAGEHEQAGPLARGFV